MKKTAIAIKEQDNVATAIKDISAGEVEDSWTDPDTLAQAVKVGLLDAPHLCGNSFAAGKVFTQIIDGACLAVDPESGKPISEKERISRILN